jgi:hypothetical protein
MQIGDIYSGYPYSVMISGINDKSISVIPITADKNKIDKLNHNCYTEFMLNDRTVYDLLYLAETVQNVNSTKLDNLDTDICKHILMDYAVKMLGLNLVIK